MYALPKFFTFPIEIHILALMNVVSYTGTAWKIIFVENFIHTVFVSFPSQLLSLQFLFLLSFITIGC